MLNKRVLRQMLFEHLKKEGATDPETAAYRVAEVLKAKGQFPNAQDCGGCREDLKYYERGDLSPNDVMMISEIIWDLVVEHVLTVGKDRSNSGLPWVRLTEFGGRVINTGQEAYYDPEGYIEGLKALVPGVDSVVEQYAVEAMNCWRLGLHFSSAVMLGAAAEKAVLLLLQSIGEAETEEGPKTKIAKLLDSPRLPSIFETVQDRVRDVAKKTKMPYHVHEGSTEHLLSLFEMIRVQRNDAVHPAGARIEKTKLFLAIMSFPAAVERVYRLIGWFQSTAKETGVP